MQAPSSPTKRLPAPKSATSVWTAQLVATLWKLAVKRARKLRRQAQRAADNADVKYGSAIDAPASQTEPVGLDEASIMHEAARSMVASGVVSLADLEAITGFRVSKIDEGATSAAKDDDVCSEAATDTSDACSIADSDLSDNSFDDESLTGSPRAHLAKRLDSSKPTRRAPTSLRKPAKWVCVGYGRYVKAHE
ncbi:unnamed protein product [Phytophthora lilii]|uniref:Unnamed protein product n=1 Tax=Phytophthora lilii TaxID=2077276 RepID=A0A9W6TUC6_9STRA|nr:unnamed protein product [Phytophthora lilii]